MNRDIRGGFQANGHRRVLVLPIVTASDCYVTLWLPTACSQRLQTRTVRNSRNPVWNQSFHFRVNSQLRVGHAPCPVPSQPLVPCPPLPAALPFSFQNILQLKIFDQDLVTSDDHLLSVLFDVGTLQAGQPLHNSFPLGTKARGCSGRAQPHSPGAAVLRGGSCLALNH